MDRAAFCGKKGAASRFRSSALWLVSSGLVVKLHVPHEVSWRPTGGGGTQLGWVPVVEGAGGVLPDSPDALMERGEFHSGPIIVGTNRNEYGLFALLQGSVTSVQQMRAQLQRRYPNHVDQIMALYAPSASADANQAYITLMTDLMFRCPSSFAGAISFPFRYRLLCAGCRIRAAASSMLHAAASRSA